MVPWGEGGIAPHVVSLLGMEFVHGSPASDQGGDGWGCSGRCVAGLLGQFVLYEVESLHGPSGFGSGFQSL